MLMHWMSVIALLGAVLVVGTLAGTHWGLICLNTRAHDLLANNWCAWRRMPGQKTGQKVLERQQRQAPVIAKLPL